MTASFSGFLDSLFFMTMLGKMLTVQEYSRFQYTSRALLDDCKNDSWPVISVEGGLFTTAAYLKVSSS